MRILSAVLFLLASLTGSLGQSYPSSTLENVTIRNRLNEGKVVPRFPTLAEIKALPLTGKAAGYLIERDGTTAAGDTAPTRYTLSLSNCTAADDVTQIQPNAGTGCWVSSPIFHSIAANTILGNGTAGAAAPTALPTAPGVINALGLGLDGTGATGGMLTDAIFGRANTWSGVNQWANSVTGTGSVPTGNNVTCSYQGNFGNPYAYGLGCLNITVNESATGMYGAPTPVLLTYNHTKISGNGSNGFYNAIGTLSQMVTGDGGAFTTLSGTAAASATTISLTSTTGIVANDYVWIMLDTGRLFSTQVTSTGAGTVNINPAMPSQATAGNAFYDPKGVAAGAILQSQGGTNSTSATGLVSLIGAAVTNYSFAGSTFARSAFLSVERDVPSNAKATLWDSMINITGQSGITTYADYGISIDDEVGTFPIAPTGTIIDVASRFNTTHSVANFANLSSVNLTGNLARWTPDQTHFYSIAGNGAATLGNNSKFYGNYLATVWHDTQPADCTTGGMLRLTGDGSGNWVFQENTSVACDFATSVEVLRIAPAGPITAIGLVAQSIALTNKFASSTSPTIASGFCTSPTIPSVNGTVAFEINVGTGCASGSGVITMPALHTGWVCDAHDTTTPATIVVEQIAETASSVTLQAYGRTGGGATNFVDGDIIHIKCAAY